MIWNFTTIGGESLGLQAIVPDKSGSGTGEGYIQVGEAFTAPILRDVLPEGLPVPSAILILADPGAGRELLTLELLSTRLRAGHKVLWISLENFPNALKATFELAGVDKTIHERIDSLEFVDCYSSQVGVKSTERYTADPSNLPNLSVAISLAISKLSRDAHLVVMFDSLSSLVQIAGARAAIEFFRALVGKVRSVQGGLLTTLNRKAFSPTVLASVQEMVDGVLELRMTDDQTDVRRYLRIRKMLGRKYDSMSIPYDIDQENGILQRIDSDSVGLVSELTIGVSEHDGAEDLRSTVWSGSTTRNAPMATDNLNELFRAAKDRTYLSSKGTLSRVPTSGEPSPLTQYIAVEEALVQAIDNGLLALGEIVRDTLYDRFEKKYQLKREEIPEKLDTFHNALQMMLGAGARVIETQIAKSLVSRLDLDFTENVDWTIVDYFHYARKNQAAT
jgi:KaiC/GvpD/RAD55 family RecA-like ATPase